MAHRKVHRNRRLVNRWLIHLVRPLFRYSFSRDAYILRGVGERLGPVLVMAKPTPEVVSTSIVD